jgi:hypothetical protein
MAERSLFKRLGYRFLRMLCRVAAVTLFRMRCTGYELADHVRQRHPHRPGRHGAGRHQGDAEAVEAVLLFPEGTRSLDGEAAGLSLLAGHGQFALAGTVPAG